MKSWLRYLPFGLSCLAIGWLLLKQCQQHQPQLQSWSQLPQHEQIQVYMNHNPMQTYTDPYRDQTRAGDDLEQVIVEQIQAARTSVEVAVQELRSPKIAAALRDRSQAGLQVRVILENLYSRPWSRFTPAEVEQLDSRYRQRYQDGFALIDQNQDKHLDAEEIQTFDALAIIQQAGIPWLDDTADGSAGSGLMHHKFVVVDGQTVIVATANFTLSGLHGDLDRPTSRGNANSLVVLHSPTLATAFQEEFNLLWGDGPGGQLNSQFGVNKPFRPTQTVSLGDASVHVRFSPTSSTLPWSTSTNGLIDQTLQRAESTIDLALFVFSAQPLVNQLARQRQDRVRIRALIDSSFAFRSYSEALDMLGVARPRIDRQTGDCTYEADNQPWPTPITTVGVTQLPTGDRLHHKYGVIDQKIVIMGSHNWSEAANRVNDETLLVIEHPTVAAHYHREFERLYATSRLGLPAPLQRKIAQLKQSQCQAWPQAKAPPGQSTPSRSPSLPVTGSASPLATTVAPRTPLNLNIATQAELETIPGIGPKLAQRIMAARPFDSLEDVDRIPGMGPQLMQILTAHTAWPPE